MNEKPEPGEGQQAIFGVLNDMEQKNKLHDVFEQLKEKEQKDKLMAQANKGRMAQAVREVEMSREAKKFMAHLLMAYAYKKGDLKKGEPFDLLMSNEDMEVVGQFSTLSIEFNRDTKSLTVRMCITKDVRPSIILPEVSPIKKNDEQNS